MIRSRPRVACSALWILENRLIRVVGARSRCLALPLGGEESSRETHQVWTTRPVRIVSKVTRVPK